MDDELLARFHGYTQWAKQMHWNIQESRIHKRELFNVFQQYKDKPQLILAQTQHAKTLIHKKQIPHGEELVAVFHDMSQSQKELLPLFSGMHAALFVQNIVEISARMHQHALVLFDSQQRQLRVLNGFSAEVYKDLLPHLFFLYEKEKKLQAAMIQEAGKIELNRKKVVRHMHENYITRLRKLHEDDTFRENHREILHGTYLISLSGSVFAHLYGISQKEGQVHENEFLNAIAQF